MSSILLCSPLDAAINIECPDSAPPISTHTVALTYPNDLGVLSLSLEQGTTLKRWKKWLAETGEKRRNSQQFFLNSDII